ncbi:hypothetical protein BT96DRAFT_1047138 [Gymnopus androsaceus JB14]|uniref:Uncharacterized protein n=1 Tax=Gymnopus androsaceus JB14 TaxID=1447944 RepID=A0A6A4HA45_9AGAR|nr:hypothetical protein BT96DRAFT_1047138 [Gymnopus androsaceus JB14]
MSQWLLRKRYSLEREQVSALIQESCTAIDSQGEEATEVKAEVEAMMEEALEVGAGAMASATLTEVGEEESAEELKTETELLLMPLLLPLELPQAQAMFTEIMKSSITEIPVGNKGAYRGSKERDVHLHQEWCSGIMIAQELNEGKSVR